MADPEATAGNELKEDSDVRKFRASDILEIIVGACVLAIPIACTEEVWRLGETLPTRNIVAVCVTSIVVVSLFVYFIFYKENLRGNTGQFLLRIFACYGVTLLVVLFILGMFQKLPWQSDPVIAIKRVILVGFPACFSATVLDALKKG